jgi:uncharacterized SAM-binding protein YcdF (DUF218 family)
VLQDDFQVPVRWEEGRSADTWQNAEFSARILHQAGISRVYLVTHSWRCLLIFFAAVRTTPESGAGK